MSLAPIILFVYNRPWHTQQTVEALQKNELAAESDLFIFADGPKPDASEECLAKIKEVRQYIHAIDGFKSITIEESPENKGLANSVIAGVTKIINQFGKVIVVEDDIVTHPFFLRFMNEALDVYEKRKDIFVVSATMETFEIPSQYDKDVFLTYRMGSWGWATWQNCFCSINWDVETFPIIKKTTKRQIKQLCRGGEDLWQMLKNQSDGIIDSWAIRMQYNMAIQNKYSIRPIKSFVQNIGMDGTGIHCGDSNVQLLPMYDKNEYCIYLPQKLKINRDITNNINPQSSILQDEIKYQKNKLHDHLIFRNFWMRKQPGRKKPVSRTILIIRIDAIGDCIIWLDQAKEYRKAYPDHKLVLLHNKAWTDIAERLPYFDECIPFDRTKICNIEYYKTLISTLNKYTYERVYSPVFSRDFITVDWIVHNVNANEKIGYEGDYQNNYGALANNLYYQRHSNKYDLKAIADSWYTKLVPNDKSCIMELQRNAHFVRQTLNHEFKSSLPTIPFDLLKSDIIPASKYAVLVLGAGVAQRMWAIRNFVHIVQNLTYSHIVLCGSEREQYLSESFTNEYKGDKTIINLTGKTNLIELTSIISNASLIITNETSSSHIAVATRTPSVCLFGGGHYGRFHPYQVENINEGDKKFLPVVVTARDKFCFNCNWKCKYPLKNERWKCIDDIKVEDVDVAIQKVISNNN